MESPRESKSTERTTDGIELQEMNISREDGIEQAMAGSSSGRDETSKEKDDSDERLSLDSMPGSEAGVSDAEQFHVVVQVHASEHGGVVTPRSISVYPALQQSAESSSEEGARSSDNAEGDAEDVGSDREEAATSESDQESDSSDEDDSSSGSSDEDSELSRAPSLSDSWLGSEETVQFSRAISHASCIIGSACVGLQKFSRSLASQMPRNASNWYQMASTSSKMETIATQICFRTQSLKQMTLEEVGVLHQRIRGIAKLGRLLALGCDDMIKEINSTLIIVADTEKAFSRETMRAIGDLKKIAGSIFPPVIDLAEATNQLETVLGVREDKIVLEIARTPEEPPPQDPVQEVPAQVPVDIPSTLTGSSSIMDTIWRCPSFRRPRKVGTRMRVMLRIAFLMILTLSIIFGTYHFYHWVKNS